MLSHLSQVKEGKMKRVRKKSGGKYMAHRASRDSRDTLRASAVLLMLFLQRCSSASAAALVPRAVRSAPRR
jgi:hypothetical protein